MSCTAHTWKIAVKMANSVRSYIHRKLRSKDGGDHWSVLVVRRQTMTSLVVQWNNILLWRWENEWLEAGAWKSKRLEEIEAQTDNVFCKIRTTKVEIEGVLPLPFGSLRTRQAPSDNRMRRMWFSSRLRVPHEQQGLASGVWEPSRCSLRRLNSSLLLTPPPLLSVFGAQFLSASALARWVERFYWNWNTFAWRTMEPGTVEEHIAEYATLSSY